MHDLVHTRIHARFRGGRFNRRAFNNIKEGRELIPSHLRAIPFRDFFFYTNELRTIIGIEKMRRNGIVRISIVRTLTRANNGPFERQTEWSSSPERNLPPLIGAK